MRKMNPRTKLVRRKMPETRINLPNNGLRQSLFFFCCFVLQSLASPGCFIEWVNGKIDTQEASLYNSKTSSVNCYFLDPMLLLLV